MKAGIAVVLVALLGLGEYAFVEYYPLEPYQREQRLIRLPVVGSIVKACQARRQERSVTEIRAKAESGDPYAMLTLFLIGKTRTGATDMQGATILLRESSSPTATMFLNAFITQEYEPDSREAMLLRARAMIENLRRDEQDEALFDRQTRQFDSELSALFQVSKDGNEDARWVVDHLAEN